MNNLQDKIYESWIDSAFSASKDDIDYHEKIYNETSHIYYT